MSTNEETSIGEKIRKYREEKGWNQKELADKANVSASTISKAEGDIYTPSPEKLHRIAKALSLPFDELIDPAAELEVSNLLSIAKIFVERKEFSHALQRIAELKYVADFWSTRNES